MIHHTTAASARKTFGQLLHQVRDRRDSVLITRHGKPVAALIDVDLFEQIRRRLRDFRTLTEVLGRSYAGVDPAIASAEITEAVAAARRQRAARSTRTRR